MKRDRKLLSQLLLVSACLLFVWFMGVNGLTRVPLANHDEAQTLRHIFGNSLNTPQPLQKTVASVAEFSSQHGPCTSFLLNVWSTFAGGDLFSLRLLSIFAAILSLAVVHRLAWLSRDRQIALAAVFILAVNWLFLFQSRELRMYTLLPCLTAWIVLSYWRLLKADGRRFRGSGCRFCCQHRAYPVPALLRHFRFGGYWRVSPAFCTQEQILDLHRHCFFRGRDVIHALAADRIWGLGRVFQQVSHRHVCARVSHEHCKCLC